MADLLAIYNAGLRAVGEETLVDLTEMVEQKVHLDDIWGYGALDACFKLARPDFARRTVRLVGVTSTHPAHEYEFTLPDNLLAILRDDTGRAAIFANADLDQVLTRTLREGGLLLADVPQLYLRYVARVDDMSTYSPEFLEVLASYLGSQLAPRIAPDKMEMLQARLDMAVKVCGAMGAEQWASNRTAKTQSSLSNDWLAVYRDAVQMLGKSPLTGPDDDSEVRMQLDIARAAGAIEALLDDTGWGFARTTVKLDSRPDLEPAWGHRSVFEKPDDCLRINGVFADDRLTVGLREYKDEGGLLFGDINTIYLEYIPTTLADNPGAWPPYFRRFVAAELAMRVSGVEALAVNPGQRGFIAAEHGRRDGEARNTAAMQDPPRIIRAGSWVRAHLGYGRTRSGSGSGSRY